MPRKRAIGRQSKDIGQRFNVGVTSGVTFVTMPSGTTVANAGITTPLVTAASIINSANSGYPIVGLSDAIMIVSGTTRTFGGGSQYFHATGSGGDPKFGLGMTTITAFIATCGLRSDVTRTHIVVENTGTGAGVTIYTLGVVSGSTNTSAVSVDYIAIGT